MAKRLRPTNGFNATPGLVIEQTPDETGAQAMVRKLLNPQLRNALSASAFAEKMLADSIEKPGVSDYFGHVDKVAKAAEGGDLAIASRMLASQAITLDSMFTELARRAALNMGESVNAAETYGRLALRAQSNCRSTLEALAKLHQPREQTVRHVHVNEGGRAVITDQLHHHTGAAENGENVKQCHATGSAGIGAALLGADPFRNGVPIASGQGEVTLSHARGD